MSTASAAAADYPAAPTARRQSVDRRARGRHPDLHGGAGHDDRQRRAALHRRRASAPATDSEWVITSYLAANAIILPISGWLAIAAGPAQLLSAVDRRLHARVGVVRHGDEPRAC